MFKITKNVLKKELHIAKINFKRGVLITICLALIWASIEFYRITAQITKPGITAYIAVLGIPVLTIIFLVITGIVLNKSGVSSDGFYITEDILISVKTKVHTTAKLNTWVYYTIKFSKNGYYETSSVGIKWKEPKFSDSQYSDYSTACLSKSGDMFFLVIDKDTNKILKCFNKKEFSLKEDDFDFIDGKYYPKK